MRNCSGVKHAREDAAASGVTIDAVFGFASARKYLALAQVVMFSSAWAADEFSMLRAFGTCMLSQNKKFLFTRTKR